MFGCVSILMVVIFYVNTLFFVVCFFMREKKKTKERSYTHLFHHKQIFFTWELSIAHKAALISILTR